jgi:sugar lactone lactonase YvrE
MTQRRISLNAVTSVGTGLRRPECVVASKDGHVYVSHLGAGLLKLSPDGTQTVLGSTQMVDGELWIPNGFARREDGSFLIANMGESGGVWKLDMEGRVIPELRQVDGTTLGATNFVLRDQHDRVWITVSTRQWPISEAFKRRDGRIIADGYIVLVDRMGPRIVADGLAFANELRLSPSGDRLYVAETMGSRIKQFLVRPDGSLDAGKTFTDFAGAAFPDGITFDQEEFLWTASIISNQVIRVAPDGRQTVILEEAHKEHVQAIVAKMEDGTITREDMQTTPAHVLRNISSVCFGGADRRTVYLGSLGNDRLISFRSDVAGQPKPLGC